jgi:hypothetical protein
MINTITACLMIPTEKVPIFLIYSLCMADPPGRPVRRNRFANIEYLPDERTVDPGPGPGLTYERE